jgi:PAS domain-containing protein
VIPGRAICEELPELAGASDRLRRVAELRETAEIELSNSSHEPRARVRIFPCGSGMAVQCLDEEGATSNGNGAGDEAHNEARDGASSSEKRVERLRAYLGTLVEATNDAVIGFDEEFNVLSWNRGAQHARLRGGGDRGPLGVRARNCFAMDLEPAFRRSF